MNNIKKRFDAYFSTWDIYLSPDLIETRLRGKIVQAGWAIWYLFGSDENGEYLDYYASHRMTCDRHYRIHQDGSIENLPTVSGCRRISDDPAEDACLEADHFAENKKVSAMLKAKGFGMQGNEPGGVIINRYLAMNPVDGKAK